MAKGETVRIDLVTAGGPRTFRLEFASDAAGSAPLVTVLLDGRVAWEKYGDTGIAEFSGTLIPGPAILEITAVSEPIGLIRLSSAGSEPR